MPSSPASGRCRAQLRRDARRRCRPAWSSSHSSPRRRRRTTPVPAWRAWGGSPVPGRSRTTTPLSDAPPEAAPRTVSVREDRVWSRSPLVSFGWTVRDYAKRVWDNSGEDNVLFLAGGIAFNILLAAVPFVLLLIWFLTFLLNKSSAGATEVVTHYLDRLVPTHEERPDSPYHLL